MVYRPWVGESNCMSVERWGKENMSVDTVGESKADKMEPNFTKCPSKFSISEKRILQYFYCVKTMYIFYFI